MRGGVAYLNQDVAAEGARFGAGGSPSLRAMLRDVARQVPDPSGDGSVYDEWQRVTEIADTTSPAMGDPGGGSDFAGFYNHLGIPIVDWGFGGESGVYHSQYDDFAWMSRFGDPTFAYHADRGTTRRGNGPASRERRHPAVRLRGVRAHDAALHPSARSSLTLRGWTRLDAGAARGDRSDGARGGELRARRATPHWPARPRAAQRVAANAALREVERALTRPTGLRTRPWYRNLIYVADEDNGYANMVFPSVNEAIRGSDERLAGDELADLARRFDAATRALTHARTLRSPRSSIA